MNTDNTRSSHCIAISNREKAEFTGITDVMSFHETEILLSCPMGDISVEGENLKIDSFSVESGKLVILGMLSGVFYFDKLKTREKGIFFRKSK